MDSDLVRCMIELREIASLIVEFRTKWDGILNDIIVKIMKDPASVPTDELFQIFVQYDDDSTNLYSQAQQLAAKIAAVSSDSTSEKMNDILRGLKEREKSMMAVRQYMLSLVIEDVNLTT